jgi:hypothetical protein
MPINTTSTAQYAIANANTSFLRTLLEPEISVAKVMVKASVISSIDLSDISRVRNK